jgi:hypothetical protein
MEWFKPLHGKPVEQNVLGFDVEGTGGPNGFVCGSLVTDKTILFYTERQALWESLLDYGRRGYWLFAHNLEYDLPIVAGEHWPSGRLLFKEQGILNAEYDVGKKVAKFYDTANLFPRFSVGNLGHMVGKPKLTVEDGLIRALGDGFPWSRLERYQQVQVKDYNIRDSEIVYLAVVALQDVIMQLGGKLKSTIASCSMDIYRRTFHRWPWPVVGPETNKLAREAFYGGRVENGSVGVVEHVNMYDVNSLYPAVQRVERFPHPKHLRLETPSKWSKEYDRWAGVLSGVIQVPETFIPPLPSRQQKRLFFPFGEIRGAWDLGEIRSALSYGCKIKSIDWMLASPIKFNPFDVFIDTLWKSRVDYQASGDTRAACVKLLLNSLYGRFGLNSDNCLYRVQRYKKPSEPAGLRGAVSFDWNGELLLFVPVEWSRQPAYVNVLFAAQITAAARTRLYKTLEPQGDDAAYWDTDSIITAGTIKTGDGLGEWRQQMSDGRADLLGPKEYSLHNAMVGDVFVAKGVPVSQAREYVQTGVTRYRRALKVREAVGRNQNPAEWVECVRTRGPMVLKRVPVNMNATDGEASLTFPWEMSELAEYVKSGTVRWRRARAGYRGRSRPAVSLSSEKSKRAARKQSR